MSHIHDLSWKLVSQFISWDFCKYTSEQTDVGDTEHDVLTYLRNMIVERTEKAVSQVSEHEIIAKFIMEAKTIRNLSRMSCLENLADSIKKMCPNLTKDLVVLMAHLECFLESLENNENSENVEILESRMSIAVNEFSAKACKVLPDPPLLKILEVWQHSRCKGELPKNLDLYRKVVACLQEEVKSFEMTDIASALYDDVVFKNILCSRVDSQDFSIFSSQPVEHSCPDSLQLSGQTYLLGRPPDIQSQYLNNSLSFEPSNKLPDSQQSVVPRYIPVGNTSPYRLANSIDRLGSLTQAEAFLYENPHPTSLLPGSQPSQVISANPLSPFKRTSPKRTYRTNSFSPPLIINVQPFVESEDEDSDSCYPTQKPVKLKCTRKRKKVYSEIENSSESEDTSDCDKDPDIRFLTPTLFKKGQEFESSKVIYLSDQDSCNSSVITTFFDSQQNDPSFKPAPEFVLDKPIKNTTTKKGQKMSKVKPKISENQKRTIQTTLTAFTTTSNKSSLNLNDSRADFKKNSGKKKKKKLFNIDAAPSTSTATNAFSLPIRKRKPTKKIQSLGNKRHCSSCNITYSTTQELRKHIFIFHTYDDLDD